MKLADPASLPRGPRRFVAYWLRDLAADFDKRSWLALIPFTVIICAAVGTLIANFAVVDLWTNIQNAIAFYAAGLAINAILLAVCWAAFARIFDTLGDPEFGAWMRNRTLDKFYGFYVDFIQITQMLAVSSMAVGLLACLVKEVPELAQRIVLGVAVACSLYAARWATGCVRIMQELAEYRSTFKENESNIRELRSAQ